MKRKTKVRVYNGQANLRLGIWWWQRKGYEVVGNVDARRKTLSSTKFTVTFQRPA